MTRQLKPMTAKQAALAEQAWVRRMYGQEKYVDIASDLGFEPTARKTAGEVAMAAVQRFDAEIEAGLRERPIDPDRKRRQAAEQLQRALSQQPRSAASPSLHVQVTCGGQQVGEAIVPDPIAAVRDSSLRKNQGGLPVFLRKIRPISPISLRKGG